MTFSFFSDVSNLTVFIDISGKVCIYSGERTYAVYIEFAVQTVVNIPDLSVQISNSRLKL